MTAPFREISLLRCFSPWHRGCRSVRRGRDRCTDGRRGGRGAESLDDQPDAERQLERSTGDGADEPGARDAEQLQQVAPGEACVADKTPDGQETRNESGAEEQSAEEEA